MKAPLIIAVLLLSSVIATPDCYDYSVTAVAPNYMEILPMFLYFGQVNWLTIEPGQNCGFYTYGDVFFKSNSSDVTGIYFYYLKGHNLDCSLDASIQNFPNSTWLYASSMMANQDICGYYVGVANQGSNTDMFTIIRTGAELLKWPVMALLATLSVIIY
jgi:hypothetical protein